MVVVNANGTGLAIVLDADGNPAPAASPDSGHHSGPWRLGNGRAYRDRLQSTVATTMDFQIAPGVPAIFLFATEDGTISGWNPMVNAATAVLKVSSSTGAVYKGLAMGHIAGPPAGNVLYAADFHNGNVDVFDTAFNPVTLGPSAFRDTSLPAGFAPFNVQNIGGAIYVTFAKQDANRKDDVPGPGNGYVDQFTPEGVLVRQLEHGPWLDSPWGIALAPPDFGELSGRLLVGNFGSGQIASFSPQSGNFEGMMLSRGIHPVQIDGLWGIRFGNGGTAGPANVLFFAAGIDDEAHGLFGTLQPRNKGGGNNEDTQGGDDHGN